VDGNSGLVAEPGDLALYSQWSVGRVDGNSGLVAEPGDLALYSQLWLSQVTWLFTRSAV